MKTLVFSISPSNSDKEIIRSLQADYSISFRRLYNNMDLMKDKEFFNSLRVRSKKQAEYLQKEVVAFYDRNQANKQKIYDKITQLQSIRKSTSRQFRQLQKLKRSYNKSVVFGDRKELTRLSKGNGNKDRWQESRLLPLVFYGEANRFGNRFFDLKHISNGKILFKLESTTIRIPIEFNNRKHQDELLRIQELILNKVLPVTIKLTYNKLYITYDEAIIAGTKLDIKNFYKSISHVKDKNRRKKLIANKHREHEAHLKRGKLERYLAIDLNPDGIGYCITESDCRVVRKGFLDISKVLNANKKRYETSILIKELFKLIGYYRCSYIVVEELNLKETNLGNRVSNRKVNNLWNRGFIEQLLRRRCNETGTILIEVNPVYTSFIGNIIHNEFDPIAASLEICRRGINKYSKGGFYPELNTTAYVNDWRYDAIKECSTWKELYSLFVTSKWSYRRKLSQFNFSVHCIESRKSGCLRLRFP